MMEMISRLSKSTRYGALIVLTVLIICFFVFDKVTQDGMIDFIKWAYGIYAASEVGAKVAARDKI